MASQKSHPYISGPGNVAHMISHLRKSFPVAVTSDTVKKLGIAPNNESYVINALQFIGLLDGDGRRTAEAAKVFANHKDAEFAQAFESIVKEHYQTLFELHGDQAWNLNLDDLITFFRQSDQTSATIGQRQASTFKVFAGLAGHGDVPAPKTAKSSPRQATTRRPKPEMKATTAPPTYGVATAGTGKSVGLTVRIEVNLPADASKQTYDDIFRSIRENLIDE